MAKSDINGLLYVYQELCSIHDSPVFPAIIVQDAHQSSHIQWCGKGAHVLTPEQKSLAEINVPDQPYEQ